MNRSQAFSSDMDKLDRRTRGTPATKREEALLRLFEGEVGDLGGDFARDLFSEYLEVLRGRGLEDPFALPDWLYGCSTLAARDYDSAAGFGPSDWAAIARCVDGSATVLDMDFVNYAMTLALEGGGLK